ncbi:MAG: DNA mismatch repair protein MutL, partial [Tissierellia bacterium]|nr:DNA mismatch repair protein MutL [Tissierellia bacterium]
SPVFVGGGQAATSVEAGDVTIGLQQAIDDLERKTGIHGPYTSMLATSSAAGGLKMTVHGLVHDMTVKAAREAALGAGANIRMITSGRMRQTDLTKVKDINPNIILIAGGVDYGERDTALSNAEMILSLGLNIPVIYAGNIENQAEIKLMFEQAGQSEHLFVVENVYPSIDELNVLPTRKVIQQVFEEHIIHAKGMEKIRNMIDSKIIPTPGSVMLATELIAEELGDVMTIDVGGATTDVHSVTEGSEEITRMQIAPEPTSKRTVEGDLGLFLNRTNLLQLIDQKELLKKADLTEDDLSQLLDRYHAIPETDEQMRLVYALTEVAAIVSTHRHSGGLKDFYYTGGKKSVAMGKDLTNIHTIIGTGGALTRLPKTDRILEAIPLSNPGNKLLPGEGVKVLIDHDYIMASLGVLSMTHKAGALQLLKQTLGLSGGNDVSQTSD